MSYAARFEKRSEDGQVHVFFDAYPEAVAAGPDVLSALAEAELALEAAVLGRLADGMDLPLPKRVGASGGVLVAVPALAAAKAVTITTWREANITKTELARRLGVEEGEVRRILDPYHRTKIDRLAAATAALGRRIVIGVADAPRSAA
jgi:antitoxin HicB